VSRKFEGLELVIATHNPGKVREIAALLAPYISKFKSAGELGLAEPEETGNTFAENAKIKALASALASGKPSLADDSGLAVYALNGDPGIYSARWAGPTKDFTIAMKKVEDALGGNPNRRAAFICALCLAWPDGYCESVEGRIEGVLRFPPDGKHGFGYDPIFIPDGHLVTFAEMAPEAKHAISHRADAFTQLVERCFR
jgi:XTP/dITP diphosphohydrolase